MADNERVKSARIARDYFYQIRQPLDPVNPTMSPQRKELLHWLSHYELGILTDIDFFREKRQLHLLTVEKGEKGWRKPKIVIRFQVAIDSPDPLTLWGLDAALQKKDDKWVPSVVTYAQVLRSRYDTLKSNFLRGGNFNDEFYIQVPADAIVTSTVISLDTDLRFTGISYMERNRVAGCTLTQSVSINKGPIIAGIEIAGDHDIMAILKPIMEALPMEKTEIEGRFSE